VNQLLGRTIMTPAPESEHLRIATRLSLASVMNATKWHELFTELEVMRGNLDFRRKDIRDSFTDEPKWNGDIYEMFGLPEFIEWLDVRSSNPGQLLDAARRLGMGSEQPGGELRFYGYLRPEETPA